MKVRPALNEFASTARSSAAAAWCSWSAATRGISSGRASELTAVDTACATEEVRRMPRLLGVDIPNDRPTVISLTYLYGVGPKIARELCHKAGVDPQARARDLREDELARLAALLDKDYVVEGSCAGRSAQNIVAAEGHRLLPRHPASPRPAGARPAHPHQRPHPQGPEEDGRRQEGREGFEVSVATQAAICSRPGRLRSRRCTASEAWTYNAQQVQRSVGARRATMA